MSKTGAVKIAWLSVWLVLTVSLVATYNSTTNRDNYLVLDVALLALTFPIGFSVVGLYVLVGVLLEKLFSRELPAGRVGMSVDSLVFLTAGYLQWFVFVPRLLRKSGQTSSHS